MAHLIDMSNYRANMAYVGETPWHGLGKLLTPDASCEVWAREAGMNWEAKLASVAYKPRLRGQSDADAKVRVSNEDRILYRDDTGARLGRVSPDYRAVQPLTLIRFFDGIAQACAGSHIETAGCLKGGRIAWALARLGGEWKMGPGEVLRPFLLLSTSFDGSRATEARIVATRVVCANTIAVAHGEKGASVVKVRHSSTFDPDSVKLKLSVGPTMTAWVEQGRAMATRPITTEQTVDYFVRVFLGMTAEEANATKAAQDSARRLLARIVPVLNSAPGQRTDAASGSVWGAFNAVTRYVDHEARTRGGDAAENRIVSANFGSGATTKARAWDLAVAMAA